MRVCLVGAAGPCDDAMHADVALLLTWRQARAALQKQAAKYNVVIMSYEALRADADWVAARRWGYAVLDEGHIIRNPKSLISQVRCQATPLPPSRLKP